MSEHMSRDPWRENADWVWDRRKNPHLSSLAVLKVKLASDHTDLILVAENWLSQLHVASDDTWFWGGFSCQMLSKTASEITLQLSSSGEDTYETLVDASRWLHAELVVPNKDVRVEWQELPLQTGSR